jgi:chemotaxis protein MotB
VAQEDLENVDKEVENNAPAEDEKVSEEVVCEAGAPGWVVTFGDMMSLLLTFFILLLSFSTLDQVKFNKFTGLIKEGFGLITRTNSKRIPKRDTMVKIKRENVQRNSRRRSGGNDMRRLVDQVNGSSTNDYAKTAVDVFQKHSDVKVMVPADDIFLSGTAQIRPSVFPMLNLFATQARDVMSDKEFSIEVRSSKKAKCDMSFFANTECDYWMLTSYQAIALSKYMQDEGKLNPARIIPVGRGTSPPAFIAKEERIKKRGSTVEFLYVTPPQDVRR